MKELIQVNIRKDLLTKIQTRVRKYRSRLNMRIPIYEEHASIDFGKYLAVIREKKFWTQTQITENCTENQLYSPENRAVKDARIDIVNHIINSIHDVEELLDSIEENNLIPDIDDCELSELTV